MAVNKTLLIFLAFFLIQAGIVRAESEVPRDTEKSGSAQADTVKTEPGVSEDTGKPGTTEEPALDTRADDPYDDITWEDVIEDENEITYEAHYIRHERDEDGSSQILTATSSQSDGPNTVVVLDT